ncbi:MAG TPA: ABC transporter permease [Rectinemataceae bacterium]|nr:ABC transporter permease [Rectinemataceae bacterium]
MATKKKNALIIPLIAILGGFALGSLVIIGTGRSPIAMFQSMLQGATGILPGGGFNPRYVGEFIIQAMPIMLTGLSVGFAFRTGLFNIGAEGQLMMGSVAATAVALWVPAPPILHVILVLLAAAAAGGLWGAVPGWFKARFNIHEVVVTIMMNYMALFLNNWMVVYVFGSKDRIKTAMFPATALLKDEFLSHLTNFSRLNWGFIPVILSVIIFWFIIDKTTFGFSLRAVGFNKEGARYAGMRVERNIVLSMVIAGAFAGLAGAVLTVGTFNYGRFLPAMEGYGMDGIAVALVGGNAAIGIFLSALLFGMLKAAQPLMQSQGVPKDIASIIQASIVLFIAMKLGIEHILYRVKKKPIEGASEEAGT